MRSPGVRPVVLLRGKPASGVAHEPNRRFGFLHIPKTAGSSFEKLLREHYGDAFSIFSVHDYFSFPELFRSCAMVAGHIPYYVFAAEDAERVLLTFLRSPIERVVSNYKAILAMPGHYAHEYVRRYRLTLADTLEHSALHNEGSNLQTKMLGWSPAESRRPLDAENDPRRRWQLFYEEHADYTYAEVDERCYASACRRLEDGAVAFGLVEEADRSFRELYGLATGRRLHGLVHENRTAEVGYRVTDRDLEAVVRHNAFDIRLYEHARRLYADRARPTLRSVARSAIGLFGGSG